MAETTEQSRMLEIEERHLRPGEKVLWTGHAEPFSPADCPDWPSIQRMRLISAIAWAIVTVLCVIYMIHHHTAMPIILIGLAAVFPIVYLASPNAERKNVMRCIYMITDQRILCQGTERLCTFSYDENTPYHIETLKNGCDVLYIGEPALHCKPGFARAAATMGFRDGMADYTGIVFYSVRDAEQLVRDYTTFAAQRK